MTFDHIRGQKTAIETLTRALQGDLLHHAYRFEGPEGVGKELAAVALAQALVCERPAGRVAGRVADGVAGCGACSACRRAAQRSETAPEVPLHPDVVLVARGLYLPETIGGKKETNEISVEQIRRVVLSRAAYTPHEGRAQVFIVRDADQLSISAANALLKTLEEPRPQTHFVLLTAQSERLLDTIRSRTLPVRFGALSDDVLAGILRDRGIEAARIPELVELAGGSASAALAAAESTASGAPFVAEILRAVDAPDLQSAIQVAEASSHSRTELITELRGLAGAYARRVRTHVKVNAAAAEIAARQHELVLDAIDAVERNGSASLAITTLVHSLRHGWLRRPGEKPPIVVTTRR